MALAEVLDELTLIRHHDWACVKEWYYMPPDGNLEPCWVCSKRKPLNYTDMLILECSQDVTFQWGDASSSDYQDMSQPEYYSYAEKQDYTPIFIDLDTNDHPLEIGAFVEDSCIGAVVVDQEDSLVMIRGYMPGDTSGTISFEKYYGTTKSTPDRINEYFVLNPKTHFHEKRAIRSHENRNYYHVSLKKDEDQLNSLINPLILIIQPNPNTGSCILEYVIPTESKVLIDVFDLYGRKYTSSQSESTLPSGNYSVSLHDLVKHTLSPGVYMVRISAGGNSATQKLIITK